MYEIIFAAAIDDLIWLLLLIITVWHVIKSADHRFVIPMSLIILIFQIISSFFINGVIIAMKGKHALFIVTSISVVFILIDICVFIWIATTVRANKRSVMEGGEEPSMMQCIDFISGKDVKVRRYEVLTLSNGVDCVDIWPDDILKITLWDNSEEIGRVCWSIDPGCISLKQNERERLTIPPTYIKQLEILDYSPSRVMMKARVE